MKCTKLLLITSALFLSFVAQAAELPPLLKEVEARYHKAGALTAQFKQTKISAALKRKELSEGEIILSFPNKVRWETKSPDRSLLVTDGKKIWNYTPPFEEGENGQLVEFRFTPVQARLAQIFLSASFSQAKGLYVKTEGMGNFTLTPKKKGSLGFEVVKIHVDETKKLINKISFEYEGGNQTEITLSNIELGSKLDPGLFRFIAPPNTDVVREDAQKKRSK